VVLSAGGVPVAGTVALAGNLQTLTLTPSAALAAGTTYTVSVSGFSDNAGNAVAPFTSSFTTGTTTALAGALAVTAVTPVNGATTVPVNSAVTITFNEVVDPNSVNASTFFVYDPSASSSHLAGTYQVSGNTVTFTPVSPLPGGVLLYGYMYGITDFAGNTTSYSWPFTTAATADTTPPTVVSVTPSNGATGVGLSALVVVTFSKSLNAATVNNNTMALFVNGTARIGGVNSISSDNRTVTLYGGTLPGSTTLTVVATSGVQDLSGNHLTDFSSRFTTMAAAPNATAPTVVGQRPANGAMGVAVGTNVVLFVSEALDPATVNTGSVHLAQNGVVVPGTVTLTGNGQEIVLQPSAALLPGNALIQVYVDATVKDLNGNAMGRTRRRSARRWIRA